MFGQALGWATSPRNLKKTTMPSVDSQNLVALECVAPSGDTETEGDGDKDEDDYKDEDEDIVTPLVDVTSPPATFRRATSAPPQLRA